MWTATCDHFPKYANRHCIYICQPTWGTSPLSPPLPSVYMVSFFEVNHFHSTCNQLPAPDCTVSLSTTWTHTLTDVFTYLLKAVPQWVQLEGVVLPVHLEDIHFWLHSLAPLQCCGVHRLLGMVLTFLHLALTLSQQADQLLLTHT